MLDMSKFSFFLKKTGDFMHTVVSIALIGIMVVVFLQTFFRVVVFYSLPWSEELSRYFFILLILWGLNIAVRDDMLIKIDLLDHYLPKKSMYVINIIRLLLALCVSLFFTYSCTQVFKISLFQVSPAIQIPMIVMYIMLFVGYLATTIGILVKIVQALKGE
jgi:TRAP-type C4-dicarboxylate transport system permease small subunit